MNGQPATGSNEPTGRQDAEAVDLSRLAGHEAKLPVTIDLGDAHAALDVFVLEIADRDAVRCPERTVTVPDQDVHLFAAELAAVTGHGTPTSVCLGRVDLHANPDTRTVTVAWSDYDAEERPVGGSVDLTYDQARRLAGWARDLPRRPELTGTELAALRAARSRP